MPVASRRLKSAPPRSDRPWPDSGAGDGLPAHNRLRAATEGASRSLTHSERPSQDQNTHSHRPKNHYKRG